MLTLVHIAIGHVNIFISILIQEQHHRPQFFIALGVLFSIRPRMKSMKAGAKAMAKGIYLHAIAEEHGLKRKQVS